MEDQITKPPTGPKPPVPKKDNGRYSLLSPEDQDLVVNDPIQQHNEALDAFSKSETNTNNARLRQALFRTYNTIGNVGSSLWYTGLTEDRDDTPMSVDEVIERLTEEDLWRHQDHFVEAATVGDFDAIAAKVRLEDEDREVIESASLTDNLLNGLLVGVVDPVNLIPLGTAVKGIKLGRASATVAGRTAATAGITESAAEVVRQQTNLTRTAGEAALDIGGSVILSGLLGGIASEAFGKTGLGRRAANQIDGLIRRKSEGQSLQHLQLKEAVDVMDNVIDEIAAIEAKGDRVPTAKIIEADAKFTAVERMQSQYDELKGLEMAKAGPLRYTQVALSRVLGKMHSSFLDPTDHFFNRTESLVGRKAAEQLLNVSVILNKNRTRMRPSVIADSMSSANAAKPKADPGSAADVLEPEATAFGAILEVEHVRVAHSTLHNAMWGGSLTDIAKRSVKADDSYYTSARRDGFSGGMEDFNKEIAKAVITGDKYITTNSGVLRARQHVEAFLKTIRDEARAAGYDIPEGQKFSNGVFTRRYIMAAVHGNDGKGTAFKADIIPWYRAELLEAAQAKLERGAKLSPSALDAIEKRARELTENAYRKITSDIIEDPGGGVNAFSAAASRTNPFKERNVPIPDSILLERGYIDARISEVLEMHMRRTVPQIMMARRFKDAEGLPDPNMTQVFSDLDAEMQQRMAKTPDKKAAEKLRLEYKQSASVLASLRDNYLKGPSLGLGSGNRVTAAEGMIHNVLTYQATRLMGQLTVSSIPDAANLVVNHGATRTLKTFGKSFSQFGRKITGTLKKDVHYQEEFARQVAGVEYAMNATVASQLDLQSPYQDPNRTMQMFHNFSQAFSRANLSVTWNASMRTAAGRATTDRILDAATKGWKNLPKWNQTYLTRMGLDEADITAISDQYRQQSMISDTFLRTALPSEWTDKKLVRKFENAVLKDNFSTVIKPHLGDRGTAYENMAAKVIFQFQNFISGHSTKLLTVVEQRLRGDGVITQDKARIAAGVASIVAAGMGTTWLSAYIRDGFDADGPNVKALENNTGQWVAYAMERTGITGMLGYYNTYHERMGGRKGLTEQLQGAFGDEESEIINKRRWRDRTMLQIFGGPTLSQGEDAINTSSRFVNNFLQDEDEDSPIVGRDAKHIREALPAQNLFYLRYGFDLLEKATAEGLLDLDDYREGDRFFAPTND